MTYCAQTAKGTLHNAINYLPLQSAPRNKRINKAGRRAPISPKLRGFLEASLQTRTFMKTFLFLSLSLFNVNMCEKRNFSSRVVERSQAASLLTIAKRCVPIRWEFISTSTIQSILRCLNEQSGMVSGGDKHREQVIYSAFPVWFLS